METLDKGIIQVRGGTERNGARFRPAQKGVPPETYGLWSGANPVRRHERSFWGSGNVLFLALSVGYCFGFHTKLL